MLLTVLLLATVGPLPATGSDAFVLKLRPDGSAPAYSTRLGSLGGLAALGDTWGRALAIAPDPQNPSQDDAYVTGQTDSPDYPVTILSPLGLSAGTLPQVAHGLCTTTRPQDTGDRLAGPCYDAFVTRLGPTGAISYSTYLGGGQDDLGYGIAASSAGLVDVTGRTNSYDFPISGTLQSFDQTPYSGTLSALPLLGPVLGALLLTAPVPTCQETSCPDAFVAQLDTTAGLTSTGTGVPQLWALTQPLLSQLTGDLTSTLATTTSLTQTVSLSGTPEGALHLDAPGALLGPASERWGTYLGGSGADEGRALALDPAGNVYVTGATASADYPTTTGAYSTTFSGTPCPDGLPCPDVLVAKLPADGSRLAYSSRFGGSGADEGTALAVDTSGHAYLTGQTASSDFPLLGSLEGFSGTHTISSTTSYTTSMGFVVRMNKWGTARFYSSYLGGSGGDAGSALAVDGIGDVMLAGQTGSADFLTLRPARRPGRPVPTAASMASSAGSTPRCATSPTATTSWTASVA